MQLSHYTDEWRLTLKTDTYAAYEAGSLVLLYLNYNTIISEWCNGSTTDFGSVSVGSNPSSETKK